MRKDGSCDPVKRLFRHLESDWRYLLDLNKVDQMNKEDLSKDQIKAYKRLSETPLMEEDDGNGFKLTGAGEKMKETFEEIINLTGYQNKEKEILIIDDDPKMADMFERWLKDEFSFKATDSKDYISEITDETDIVVIERFLKNESAKEAVSNIKARWPETPVICLVGVDPEIEGKKVGADHYMVKPVEREEFIQKIRDISSP